MQHISNHRSQAVGEQLALENFGLADELAAQKLTLHDVNAFLTSELKARSAAAAQVTSRLSSQRGGAAARRSLDGRACCIEIGCQLPHRPPSSHTHPTHLLLAAPSLLLAACAPARGACGQPDSQPGHSTQGSAGEHAGLVGQAAERCASWCDTSVCVCERGKLRMGGLSFLCQCVNKQAPLPAAGTAMHHLGCVLHNPSTGGGGTRAGSGCCRRCCCPGGASHQWRRGCKPAAGQRQRSCAAAGDQGEAGADRGGAQCCAGSSAEGV